ncbi:rRNA maturation RNase YbeY [Salsuginibacillus kocurii]|uniref:rRNA maturation RNase YbeY n=1 Tax=Salsuginibacillus kocurii TaxID=427078 RepID=UPI000361061A|nr:rRNA maturation RNase YbeY [Salsuginibacillus kocurii]
MYTIDLHDETNTLEEQITTLVADLLKHCCAYEKVPSGSELSVTFVSDESIQELNWTYREKDAPTDVLSFALNEGEEEALNVDQDIPDLLGDIVISVPRAKQQAEEYGHSFERELGFLAVHGFLHLLGYDHETEAEEKEMFARQKDILEAYNLGR